MGFKEAKRWLVESLINGNYIIYTERPNIEDKNLLHTEEVDVDLVLEKVKMCRGFNHKREEDCSMADDNYMHVFKIEGWYIKYFLSNCKVFIVSVHEEESK